MTRIRSAITDDNRRWWTLGAMCFALFMIMLDNTVVNVALPSIQRDLDARSPASSGRSTPTRCPSPSCSSPAAASATSSAAGACSSSASSSSALSSAFIGFSQSEAWLVAGRAVQGVGAAFMMPGTLSIITNAFPPQERGKAIGTWAGVSAIALAIGPVVGGFLVENVSWQSIFFLNVPVAAVAVVVTLFADPRVARRDRRRHQVDFPGVATLTVGLGALVLALVEGNSWGWGSARDHRPVRASRSSALVGFVLIERQSRAPMVDFAFFRSRSFLGANVVAFIVSFAMLAMFFFLALYMQNILGYSPLEAGVRFLPSTAGDHRRRPARRAA